MNVTDLRIYNISLKLSKEVLDLVNRIPDNWRIKDVNDIKRSCTSVPSNITEGFARRFYPKDFIRFLNVALGSSDETQTHLKSLFNQKFINETDFKYYFTAYKDLSIRILNYINYQKKKHNIRI
jgi:four helix bundle protein